MKALYKKETLKDPESENSAYSNFTLKRDTEFCCEKFKNYCKNLPSGVMNMANFQ